MLKIKKLKNKNKKIDGALCMSVHMRMIPKTSVYEFQLLFS